MRYKLCTEAVGRGCEMTVGMTIREWAASRS